ncbi:MAG: MurT ligase domain-containing protein [Actinomycetota bacterium]|nr:MurT ligase domain-containing protein [Actinomycetota bacterium]
MIGGTLALAVDSTLLTELAGDRCLACVSGTNGKTTTTQLVLQALASAYDVTSNAGGANMPAGLVSALAVRPRNRFSVLEVDEVYLPGVVASVRPRTVVLLNLSRDQLDRMAETRRIAGAWREMAARASETTVVANADDPLVVWAAQTAARVVWVGAGLAWRLDATACPACGGLVRFDDAGWHCQGCELRRPEPSVEVTDGGVEVRGVRHELMLSLPGRANRSNAAMALAVADSLGVPVDEAVVRMGTVSAVDGRYSTVHVDGTGYRMLLAKNPAGWQEVLDVISTDGRPLVVAINARSADGKDTSWLWDVPFEQIAGRHVVATGDRAGDLALRLSYADVPHDVVTDRAAALRAAAARLTGARSDTGPDVDVCANYTAFRELRVL